MQICPVLLLLLMYDEAAHFWGTAFGTWRRTWRDALWDPWEVCGVRLVNSEHSKDM